MCTSIESDRPSLLLQASATPRIHPNRPRDSSQTWSARYSSVPPARPLSILNMMLVAWRVKIWWAVALSERLEPLLYRTVALHAAGIPDHPSTTSETFRSVINSGSKAFFRDTVRHVFFRRDVSHAVLKAILSTCSDIANLWMSPLVWDGNRTPLSLTGHLKLQRLHCNVENIFSTLNSIDFTHQLFANITHLQLFDPPGDRELNICLDLVQIPNLTHLSYEDPMFLLISAQLLRTSTRAGPLTAVGDTTEIHWSDGRPVDVAKTIGPIPGKILVQSGYVEDLVPEQKREAKRTKEATHEGEAAKLPERT
ncbi:hypothetical protein B0H11DRAFT_1906136 [Mycena galericulata]|nr:hypothetical protein B0H11DRAFT_1906136 [Mycena galericulata]